MNTPPPLRSPVRFLLGAGLLAATACFASAQTSGERSPAKPRSEEAAASHPSTPEEAAKDGEAKSAPTKEPERILKTDAEWRKILTADQYFVTRLKATEPAFSGRYAVGHFKGTFLCVCCGAKLFDSRTKFDSGTGWPSFWSPVAPKALEQAMDRSEAEPRIEVTCARCGAHLGHVFSDGPPPTGLRYCINSVAIKLDSEPARPTTNRRTATRKMTPSTRDARPQAPESTSPSDAAPRSKNASP